MQESMNVGLEIKSGPTFYSKNEVYKATTEYFKGNDSLANIWIDKYCLKDDNNKYLEKTPDDMHKRLAKEFARIEQKYENPLEEDEIYNLFANFRFILPGGSILYGCGNSYSISSLGNCFVIGNESDSYGGICATDQEQAQLMKRRAGVGHDLSHLRPAKSITSNAAGTSTGAVSFMDRYSHTTREVAQDGRRGALMLSIDINHPDSEQFIISKDDLSKITGANISVKIDNSFMKAVEADETYPIEFGNKVYGLIDAKKLWDKIIHQAWKSAEPGVLFWDKIKSESIPSCYGIEWEETSTNPCGEIPLCPYDSCRLLSVNLYSFVDNPFTDKASFNYDKFKDIVYKAQRLMDDIIDLEKEKINLILQKIENDPEPEEIKVIEKNLWIKIKTKLLEGRRTGLSFIGLADTFAAINIQYGSYKSIEFANEISKQFAISAYKSSIAMAKERGAFPIYSYSKEKTNPFLKRIWDNLKGENEDWTIHKINWNEYGRRNIGLLTIPPSGTISQMAEISSGIEPVYMLSYKRRRKLEKGNPKITFVDQNGDGWEEYTVLHPKFKEWMKSKANSFSDNILSIKNSPYYNATAYEIEPIQRVKLQATIQKWIDHSISSTINLPENTTEEEISNIYMTAWKEGCKGITIYRDNSRTGVLVSDTKKNITEFKQHDAPKRPKELDAEFHKVKVKGIDYGVFVGLMEGKPYEIFAYAEPDIKKTFIKGKITKIGKKDSLKRNIYSFISDEVTIDNIAINTEYAEENTFTLMLSGLLRHGAPLKFILEWIGKTELEINSFGKSIARVLKKYIADTETTKELCPNCESKLTYQDGCVTCLSCGYSKCG